MQAQNPAVTAETDCTFDFSDTPQGKNYPIFYHSGRSIPQKMPPCNGSIFAVCGSILRGCPPVRHRLLLISTPSSVYSPEVGLSSTPIIFIRVLLPEPDSPTIATNSPGHTVKLKMCDGPCRISLSEIRQSPCPSPKKQKAPFPIGNEALMQNEQFFANSAKIFFTAPRGSRPDPDEPEAGSPSSCASKRRSGR